MKICTFTIRFLKDGKLRCKRPSIAFQKATFRSAKGGLLESR